MLIRYWAAARAAAGLAEEDAHGRTLGDALDHAVARHGPALAQVVARSSFLVDEVRARRGDALSEDAVIEVLPPFAGGSGAAPAPASPRLAPAARGTLLLGLVLAVAVLLAAGLGGTGGRALLLVALLAAQGLALAGWWTLLGAPGARTGLPVAAASVVLADVLLAVRDGSPALAPVTWVLGPAVTAAIVAQLLRRDGRAHLVTSLVATLSATAVLLCGSLLVAVQRRPDGPGALGTVALAALLGTLAGLLLPVAPGERAPAPAAAVAAVAAGAGAGLLVGLVSTLGPVAGAVLGAVVGLAALLALALVTTLVAAPFAARRLGLLTAAALPLLVAGPCAWGVVLAFGG